MGSVKPQKTIKVWFSPDVSSIIESGAKEHHLTPEEYLAELARQATSLPPESPKPIHPQLQPRKSK